MPLCVAQFLTFWVSSKRRFALQLHIKRTYVGVKWADGHRSHIRCQPFEFKELGIKYKQDQTRPVYTLVLTSPNLIPKS